MSRSCGGFEGDPDDEIEDDRLRLIFTVLPRGAGDRGASRVDAACARPGRAQFAPPGRALGASA